MSDKEILMYAHAGSGNHGCEAIVRSVCGILGQENKVAVISNNADEDRSYNLDGACRLIQERDISKRFFTHTLYYARRKLTGKGESFLEYRYANAKPFENYRFAVSIGGDNYCYDMMIKDLENANRMFHQNGLKTILLGCSIEPDLIKNRADIREDMKLYDRIIARESITYNALKDAGLENVVMCPDPAFALKPEETEMPAGFVTYESCEGKADNVESAAERDKRSGDAYRDDSNGRSCSGMVGINVSPMVQDFAVTDIVLRNYERLIECILKNTDMNIALIPHVIWDRSDDRKPLQILYDKYKETGRVIMVSDRSCSELKMIISKCRFFVGARTHATIAAYSSCVPTLVAGYSVKSRGIAKDIFGTDEHYVIPVQNMKSDEELTDGFRWLADNEDEVMKKLSAVMPDYMESIGKLKNFLYE